MTAAGACSLSDSSDSGEALALRDEAAAVVFTDDHALEWRILDGGREHPIARLTDAILVLDVGDRRQEVRLRFTSASRQEHALAIALEAHPDHQLSLSIEPAGTGQFRVRLADVVGARSLVRELRLEYEWLAGPPSETFAPMLQPDADSVVGDEGFATPLLFLRTGGHALALHTDIDLLQQERPIPEALELDVRDRPRFGHGLVASVPIRGALGTTPDSFSRLLARPAITRGETLRCGHRIRLSLVAPDGRTLAREVAESWRGCAGQALAVTSRPLLAPPLEARAFEGRARLLRRVGGARTTEDLLVGLTRATGERGSAVPLLASGAGLTMAALGLARAALRAGDTAALDGAVALVNLALSAPRRSGLVATECRRDPTDGQWVWRLPASNHGHYSAVECALLGRDLLRTGTVLARVGAPEELLERIGAATREATRFFLSNQREDGSVPVWYEERYLVPARPNDGALAELGAVALLFAEQALLAENAKELSSASLRALEFLEKRSAVHGWPSSDTGSEHGDLRGGQPLRRALPLALAALACTTLHAAHAEPKVALFAEKLLDELATLQASWSPVWQREERLGAVFAGNDRLDVAPLVQRLAAEAFFAGYRLNGRRDHLQRGIAALRWLFGNGAGQDFATDAARTALAELVLAESGQAVVDVAGRFAEAVDACWIQEQAFDARTIRLRIVTHEPDIKQIRVTFQHVPATTPELEVEDGDGFRGAVTRRELSGGLLVPLRSVPAVEFRPPGEIPLDEPWLPRARLRGAASPDTVFSVEVRGAGEAPVRIPMDLADASGPLVARTPFVPTGLARGTQIEARLHCESAGVVVTEPPVGWRSLRLGEGRCIDPGDDDESSLQASTGASIVRSADGRDHSRLVRGNGAFSYRIDMTPEATTLRARLRLAGRALIESNGIVLHKDPPETTDDLREEELTVADRRLWRGGSLWLTFHCADPDDGTGMALSRIVYREAGHALSSLTPEAIGASFEARRVDGRFSVLVLPVSFPDAPLTVGAESLRQVFFGGPEYLSTPPPLPRRTAGSVATLMARMSGERTMLQGEVLRERTTHLLAADLAKLAKLGGAMAALAQSLAGFEPGGKDLPDVFLVLCGGTSLGRAFEGQVTTVGECFPSAAANLAERPILFLSERASDGTFLSTGRALAALLRARYRILDLGQPELGSFGELGLSASSSEHLTSGLAGLNLARLGWADLLRLPARDRADLALPPLHEGRVLYELACDALPGRGSVIVESRAASAAEPGLAQDGMLVYWQLDGSASIHRSDGRSVSPRLLRLSPAEGRLGTPFVPGRAAQDLFRADCILDHKSSPSLSTLQGEALWRLATQGLRVGGDRISVEYLGLDLLRAASVALVREGRRPIPDRHDDVPGTAHRGEAAITLRAPLAAGAATGALLSVGRERNLGPCRLLGHFRAVRGDGAASLRIQVGRWGCELRVDQTLSGSWFEADIDRFDASEPLEILLGPAPGGPLTVELDRLVLAERAQPWHEARGDATKLAPARMQDGTTYVATQALEVDALGRPSTRLPTLWPPEGGWLRMRLGHEFGAGRESVAKLTVRLVKRSGERTATLLDALPLRRDTDGSLPVLLLEVPPGGQKEVAFVEISLSGAPLRLVSCDLIRE